MARLTERTPAHGQLPLDIGSIRVAEVDPGRVTAILPYPGAEMSGALDALGLDWPAPGQVSTAGGVRAIWAGLDSVYLCGAAPDPALADRAALVDQSDAWAWIAVETDTLADIMARLTPLDPRALPPGRAARSFVGHMSALLVRVAERRLEIAVFRSMAGTLVHEVDRAATIVSTRVSHGL